MFPDVLVASPVDVLAAIDRGDAFVLEFGCSAATAFAAKRRLMRAGLVEVELRAGYQLTEHGRAVLADAAR